MDNKVYINASMLKDSDLEELRHSKYGDVTEFDLVLEQQLLDPGYIHCVFEMIQGIGVNGLYDLIKYCVIYLMGKVAKKSIDGKNRNTSITVELYEKGKARNHRKVIISTSYDMGIEEREKTIDSALHELLTK